MKKNRVGILSALALVCALLIGGCATSPYPLPTPADWDRAEFWYQDPRGVDAELVDVFYVASTDVLASIDPAGKHSPLARLTRAECDMLKQEMDWFRQNIYTREFNFFAPMYHQVTFEALGEPRGGRAPLWDCAAAEVCTAFDHYMKYRNQGRPFILAGFSQGASILRAILKHMTDEQYSRCVAAYAIGFQVTADDLKSPHIRPAQGEDDRGVIVSFNSVSELSGRLAVLCADAACAINPVNWRTDSTPAEFTYADIPVTATLDPDAHVVVVEGFPAVPTPYSHLFPKGNLHTYESVMYAKHLRKNALLRAYGETRAPKRWSGLSLME